MKVAELLERAAAHKAKTGRLVGILTPLRDGAGVQPYAVRSLLRLVLAMPRPDGTRLAVLGMKDPKTGEKHPEPAWVDCSNGGIEMARAELMAGAMATSVQDWLYWDDDVDIPIPTFDALMRVDAPFVCAPYTTRKGNDAGQYRWVFNVHDWMRPRVRTLNGERCLSVTACGLGAVRIRQDAMKHLLEHYPELRIRTRMGGWGAAVFNPIVGVRTERDPENTHEPFLWSEDHSFFKRVADAGIEPWMLLDHAVVHQGMVGDLRALHRKLRLPTRIG